jgi:O-antigen/teichoic acid export membrane protein
MVGQAPPAGIVRRSVLSLFVANGLSFATLGLSYLLYSRLLTPSQFGLYATALVVGNFGQLVLDGGLKNTVIKAPRPATPAQQGTLVFLMTLSSLVLISALVLGGRPLGHFYPAARQDYQFLAIFGGIYLLSYPWMAIPTAFLEREFAYTRIAFIESFGQILERATPALFLLLTPLGMSSFLLGLLLGRAFKVTAINLFHRAPIHIPTWGQIKDAAHLVAEGGWLQVGVAASQVRDSLHVLVVGPLFGQAWVGYYGWCLQLGQIASQAFVQISARVSVPVFAQSVGFATRWRLCVQQIRLLTILTGPILCTVLLVVPSVNAHLFHGKWSPALAILPLIFLRMLPGLATTPVGNLVMVHRGGRAMATALMLWTSLEVLAGIVAGKLIGPAGLAWSYAAIVWVGLWILLRALGHRDQPLFADCMRAILGRPSLAIAGALAGALIAGLTLRGTIDVVPYVWVLVPAAVIVIAAYLSEQAVRNFLQLIRAAST